MLVNTDTAARIFNRICRHRGLFDKEVQPHAVEPLLHPEKCADCGAPAHYVVIENERMDFHHWYYCGQCEVG